MIKKAGKGMLLVICMVLVFCALPFQTEAATKLNKTKAAIYVGETVQLKVKGSKKVKWSSNNKAVASVTSKGKVTGKAAGTAVITARLKKKSYKCIVTVKELTIADKIDKALKKAGRKIIFEDEEDEDDLVTIEKKSGSYVFTCRSYSGYGQYDKDAYYETVIITIDSNFSRADVQGEAPWLFFATDFQKKLYMFPYKGSFKLSDGCDSGTYEITVPEGYAEAVEAVKNALGDGAEKYSSIINGVDESTIKRHIDYTMSSIRLALSSECGVGYDEMAWGND